MREFYTHEIQLFAKDPMYQIFFGHALQGCV
jgi:hypothetical protein